MFCTDCGKKHDKAASFCQNCGRNYEIDTIEEVRNPHILSTQKYTWSSVIVGVRRVVALGMVIISAIALVLTFSVTCNCAECTELFFPRLVLAFIFVSFSFVFISSYIFRTEISVNDDGVTIIKRKKVHKQYPFSEYGFGFHRTRSISFPLPKFIRQFATDYAICVIHRETRKEKRFFCFDFSEKTINELLLNFYQRNQLLVLNTGDEIHKLAQKLQAQAELKPVVPVPKPKKEERKIK
jgi:hypothetical protein